MMSARRSDRNAKTESGGVLAGEAPALRTAKFPALSPPASCEHLIAPELKVETTARDLWVPANWAGREPASGMQEVCLWVCPSHRPLRC